MYYEKLAKKSLFKIFFKFIINSLFLQNLHELVLKYLTKKIFTMCQLLRPQSSGESDRPTGIYSPLLYIVLLEKRR